jgi:hypothetical protein
MPNSCSDFPAGNLESGDLQETSRFVKGMRKLPLEMQCFRNELELAEDKNWPSERYLVQHTDAPPVPSLPQPSELE